MPEYLRPPKFEAPVTSIIPDKDAKAGQHPVQEGQDVSFPLTGEALRAENDKLLDATINASDEVKQRRYTAFPQAWHERWRDHNDQDYFQTYPSESPFSKYSSQGWKLHIAFERGREEEVSRFLYGAGLYFKTEGRMGGGFNGLKESGSTIYVGSWDAMQAVADHLYALDPVLTDGTTASVSGKTVHAGSGTDVEIAGQPKVTARFDVQRSKHGLIKGGDGKYSESGLPSWSNIYDIFSGLPLLSEDVAAVYNLHQEILSAPQSFFTQQPQRPASRQDFERLLAASREAQERAEQELVHDFGKDFVLGQS